MKARSSILLAFATAWLSACTAILGSFDVGGGGTVGDSGVDVITADGTSDAATADGGSDARTDAPSDAGPDVQYIYNDPTSATRWESYTITQPQSFAGTAFDGRNVYLVPGSDGTTNFSTVWAYDTQGAFSGGGWKRFDMTSAVGGAGAKGFYGAGFDGKYVYFVPRGHSLLARFDTKAAGGVTTASSWSFLDISAHGSNFGNAVFDGAKYLYLLPGAASGFRIVRIDTTGSFTTGSVTSFQLLDADPNAYAFDGGTFDGKFLYLAIYKSGGPCPLMRYDISKPFATASSWTAFDLAPLGTCGHRGATYDGKYLYFVPHYGVSGFNGRILRFDPTKPFTSSSSYLVYDLATAINPNLSAFAGAVFDGRFVHLVPQGTASSGLVASYDVTKPFDADTSWKQFDTTALDANAKTFLGGVFDGRYVYMSPVGNNVVVRYDAKSPPGLPAGWGASFF